MSDLPPLINLDDAAEREFLQKAMEIAAVPLNEPYVAVMRAMKSYTNALGLSDEQADPHMRHVSQRLNDLRCERLKQAAADAMRLGEPVN